MPIQLEHGIVHNLTLCSSEDAMGATPEASKQGYINVANKQQPTIISYVSYSTFIFL